MKLLLDTNMLLWAMDDSLPEEAKALLGDSLATLFFSTISIWEVGIKNGLGKPNFLVDPRELYDTLLLCGYEELSINAEHTILSSSLPLIHKDPFDRILIAQSIKEGIPFVTSDKMIQEYPGDIRFFSK